MGIIIDLVFIDLLNAPTFSVSLCYCCRPVVAHSGKKKTLTQTKKIQVYVCMCVCVIMCVSKCVSV